MNWKSVKTYLIVLLAAINVFLSASYILSMNKSSKLSADSINNTVEFVNRNKVGITKSIIPDTIFKTGIIECTYDENYYENVPSAIRGCDRESINILPDSSIRIMMKDGSVFTFDSKFGFEFTDSSQASLSEVQSIVLPDNALADSLTKKQLKAVKQFLYPYENNTPDFFSMSINTSLSDDYKYTYVQCTQTIYNTAINTNTVTLKLVDNSIVGAIGVWYFPNEAVEYTYELFNQLSVLFKEVQSLATENVNQSVSDNTDYTITDMDYIYCVYWSAGHDHIYFIPAWKLITDNHGSRIYNAVNCELYE